MNETVGHTFSSTQVELADTLVGEKLLAFGRRILALDLAGDGRETNPHITVKYGLHDTDPTEVAHLLKNEQPFMVTFGKTAAFEGVEDGTADAVIVDVLSQDLRRLNALIASTVEVTDTHPMYQPHATIAYVKLGLGKKYAGDDTFVGQTVTVDRITFSSKDGEQTVLPLGELATLGVFDMPGSKGPHHSDKWHSCVDKVMAQGHDESSASAICTASLQKAGEPIFAAAAAARHLHLLGATSIARTEMVNGREHLVVPVVALMESVIHAVNAPTAEFVSADVLAKAASSWVDKPLCVGHPKKDGRECSANNQEILATHGFGTIRSAVMKGKKLFMEALVDPLRLKMLKCERLLADLRDGNPVEVSVGAYVTTNDTRSEFGGKPYIGEWRDVVGDHLAFLHGPGARGACSVEAGCGANRFAMRVCEDHLETVETKETSMRTASTVYDTPEQAASEEAAELVAYTTLRKLCDQLKSSYTAASDTVDELIADETEDPTETPGEEDSESELETARMETLQVLCMAMYSTLNAIQSLVSQQLAPDIADSPLSPSCCEACAASQTTCTHMSRAAAGARHSASDRTIIQGMHDHAVSLGADCPGVLEGLAALPDGAQKMTDCPTCEGTGKTGGKDCPTCDGNGEIPLKVRGAAMADVKKAADQVKNSFGKYSVADAVAEYKLSADEEAALKDLVKKDGGKPNFKNNEGTMTPEQKTELVSALVADKYSGFTADDVKMLEAAHEARLEAFKTAAAARALEETKAADERLKAAEALKVASAKQPLTEEDFMKVAPESLKALITRTQAADATHKAELVVALKAAQQAYGEAELSAMTLDNLERLAAVAKIDTPQTATFEGRPVPMRDAERNADVYANPPDPYAEGIKQMRVAAGLTVN